MSTSSRPRRQVHRAAWTQRSIRESLLETVAIGLIGVASATGLVILILTGGPPVGYAALGVTVGGIALSRWTLWPGVLLAISGPLMSGLMGDEPVLVWTLTVFATFVWCVRGAQAPAIGLVVGLANYLAFVADGGGWVDSVALLSVAITLAAAAAGTAVDARRGYLAEARRRVVEAKLTREAEVDRRIAEERLRIARDLHDMVGHQTAVVNMHLGAAEVHLPPAADQARADLHAARRGVQAVIRETQRILDILRLAPDDDALAPHADHEHLAGLVASFREAGLSVDAHIDPAPPGLSPDVSAATYRIVQESLTNAKKHGAGPVSLIVASDDREIRITVTNPVGEAKQSSDGGYGLIGMRERVSSAGGTLEAGAVDGDFTLTALMRTDGKTT